MNNDQRNIVPIAPDCYPSLFGLTMFIIENREHQRIEEYLSSSLESYPVLPEIAKGFIGVPLKLVLHSSSFLCSRII